jgi:hypothetical protein
VLHAPFLTTEVQLVLVLVLVLAFVLVLVLALVLAFVLVLVLAFVLVLVLALVLVLTLVLVLVIALVVVPVLDSARHAVRAFAGVAGDGLAGSGILRGGDVDVGGGVDGILYLRGRGLTAALLLRVSRALRLRGLQTTFDLRVALFLWVPES